MFEVDDVVMIYANDKLRREATPSSPLLNLEGSICKIKQVRKPTDSHRETSYAFEMIELHAENPKLYESWQCDLAWTDGCFVLAEKDVEIAKDEILELFLA